MLLFPFCYWLAHGRLPERAHPTALHSITCIRQLQPSPAESPLADDFPASLAPKLT
jgi:hypothetical protein